MILNKISFHFAKRLKTLKGLTPYEFIKNYWTQKPKIFKLKPTHLNLKPYKDRISPLRCL